jgi:hypothetical protein
MLRSESPGITFSEKIRKILDDISVLDLHTHLFAPCFGTLYLSGVDELLTYHYLVAETLRDSTIRPDQFWSLNRKSQAELVWETLFLKQSPLSEAAMGVVSVLNAFGLETRRRDLPLIRKWFAEQDLEKHLTRCLEFAGVREIGMTNSPFDEEELRYWGGNPSIDSRFFGTLRLDPLLVDWRTAVQHLRQLNYDLSVDFSEKTISECRRFLEDFTVRFGARFAMVSLPPDFEYDAEKGNPVLDRVLLPHCRQFGLPFALMIGVRRQVNPSLRLAGDGMGRSRLESLEALCRRNPDNRFMATVLSRENQHDLCVVARKFANLHPFGCWWFTNTASLTTEITRMRLELLGCSFTAQHSDARVLEQVVYKWRNTREMLSNVLSERYSLLASRGWPVSDDEIRRDAVSLLGGGFERFLAKTADMASEPREKTLA